MESKCVLGQSIKSKMMKFSLIICTYMRPEPLLELLQSVKGQTVCPNEILIIDGSCNQETEKALEKNSFDRLHYYKVSDEHRGLTKQRNYGIERVAEAIEVVCFLDDDTVLDADYFEKLLATYQSHPDALGVGGYINNETKWGFVGNHYTAPLNEFYFDGWKRKDGSRFVLRKKVGLDSDCPPGYSSLFSHGRSVGFLPPSEKTYEVEMLMGGVSSFRKKVFETLQFSTYFEGYGLYEDADFTLRVAKMGKLYLNTAARLSHFHADSGRPNQYQYGKMVVRNGWYVWRTKNPNPKIDSQLKWHSITILLTLVRFSNTFTSAKKAEAFTEALGRAVGWWSLLIHKPKMNI
jgi:GT2 family glycosyltransferase